MRKEITEQLKKENFLEKIINLETSEEVKKAFKEKNINISDEELKEIGKDIYSLLDKLSKTPSDVKLSDEEVEKVSGGVVITAMAALSLTTALASVVSSGMGWRAQSVRLEAAKLEHDTAQLNTSWRGIVGKNPGYLVAVGLGLGTAYVAKVFLDGIKDGSLKRWFGFSDSSSEPANVG